LLQIRGGASTSNSMADQHGERLSRACVVGKSLAWSELGQQYCLNFGLRFPAWGLQRPA
jgi:hypothetical protein